MEMDKNKRNQSIQKHNVNVAIYKKASAMVKWSNFFSSSSIAGLDLSMYKNVTLQHEVDLIGFQIGLYYCIDVG